MASSNASFVHITLQSVYDELFIFIDIKGHFALSKFPRGRFNCPCMVHIVFDLMLGLAVPFTHTPTPRLAQSLASAYNNNGDEVHSTTSLSLPPSSSH